MGSEEVVTVRRQFFASADYFTERSDFALITSGSRAEGLDMGSDLDIMLLFKNVHISEERTEESFRIPNNIVMDTDECKPCFSQLKGYSCHFDSLIKLALTPHGQEYRLESERMRYLLLSFTWLFKPFHFHGPCVSDETERGLCDLTVCLRCPVWINQAQPWIKRERYWPSPCLVSRLCSYECTTDKLFHVNNIGIANNLSEIEKHGIRRKLWKCRHLYKKHVINEISFYYNSRVIPPELDVQLTTATFIPPLVYIRFLRFLCFFRLNEKSKFMQAIQDLRSSMDEKFFNGEVSSHGEVYKCLAIALEIYGEKKDAKKYYDKYDKHKTAYKGFYF
ncbi:unnamed protein product [Mytilus edulis]|uniref:Uncharacterized protein n=1 Tax=Mytilus edulis TaxID=6550 RepID=A0A8S3QBK7_MYTED|nr:unnamed protein product [Mytilus edulis]